MKPKWLLAVFGVMTLIIGSLFYYQYFVRHPHGIVPAKDQHKELTERAVSCFEKESGIDISPKIVWVDTTCPHDDVRGIRKGQTAVLFKKPVDGGQQLICLSGLTLGNEMYVAWRGQDSNAILHELGHVAVPGYAGNHHTDPDTGLQVYNDPVWGDEIRRIENTCRNQ